MIDKIKIITKFLLSPLVIGLAIIDEKGGIPGMFFVLSVYILSPVIIPKYLGFVGIILSVFSTFYFGFGLLSYSIHKQE